MAVLRHRTATVCIAVVGLVLSGCGDGKQAKKSPAPKSSTAAPPSTPPPVLTFKHVRSSLLSAREIAANASPEDLLVPGLKDRAAPSCSDSQIALPGNPKVLTREVANKKDFFTGMHYAQLIAVYDDVKAASQGLDVIRREVGTCPKKEHVKSKKLSNGKFTIEHDNTWTVSEDTPGGWTHIRGYQKHVEPPSTSIYNVFHLVYDYASRGNTVVTSLYVQRGRPSLSGDSVTKKATDVLTKQLKKIG